MTTKSEGLGTQDLEANRTEAFGLLMSGVSCDAIGREGRDGREHSQETDLTRHQQVCEEGDTFECSFFR